MIINFVGNFSAGYVGEVGDATHLAREMEKLGHTVRKIPQDEWREYVREKYPDGKYPNIPTDLRADINIICKWHHFYDDSFIGSLKALSLAPVFYWIWDYMWGGGFPDWHIKALEACDLYLSNDMMNPNYSMFKEKCYYFPFDVADGEIPYFKNEEKKYDVAFFGSFFRVGNRIPFLKEIDKKHKVKIFAWNWEEWKKEGFDAEPAVYGAEFNQKISQTKIVLGFSVNPHTWGYWSNRVGKVLLNGGFLLYEYAPGMELFLRDGVEYFSTPEEAVEKIDHYLIADTEREKIAKIGWLIGQERFSSKERVKDLMVLCERYLKNGKEWIL